MVERPYTKQCNGERLQLELVTAGYPQDPSANARFYGVLTDCQAGVWTTTILCYDDLTGAEETAFDGIVTAHIPTPLPQPVAPVDEYGKPYVRAESRPTGCTTYFTSRADNCSGSGDIGEGEWIGWDASDAGSFSTSGYFPRSGYKQKDILFGFCDSVWLKSGLVFHRDAVNGSYIDMRVMCPPSGYFMYLGGVQQNTGSGYKEVDHYLTEHPVMGDSFMGTNVDPETCSQELPTYLKFLMTISVPTSDSGSYGALELEMYRTRTVSL